MKPEIPKGVPVTHDEIRDVVQRHLNEALKAIVKDLPEVRAAGTLSAVALQRQERLADRHGPENVPPEESLAFYEQSVTFTRLALALTHHAHEWAESKMGEAVRELAHLREREAKYRAMLTVDEAMGGED